MISWWDSPVSRNSWVPRLAPAHLSLEEVVEHADHKVLVKVDDNSALIVHVARGLQLRPHQINLLNNIIIILVISYLTMYY